MDFATTLKKAMIDMNIDSAKALSDKTGVSSYITRRLLKNDGTCCLNDLKTTTDYLGVKITYTSKGGIK